MNKVYIVTEGSYSDYHIVAVFSDEKKAKLYSLTLDDAGVEEYDVDDIDIDTNKKIITYAVVHYEPFSEMPLKHVALYEGIEGLVDFKKFKVSLSKQSYGLSTCYINTDNIDKAEKIFYDEYAKLMNEYLIVMGKGGAE